MDRNARSCRRTGEEASWHRYRYRSSTSRSFALTTSPRETGTKRDFIVERLVIYRLSGAVGGSVRASVGPQSHLHLGILTVRQVRLDASRGSTRGTRATHVPAVMAVMMMMVAGCVMRVVVIVMIEMRWLRGRRRATPISPLLLLEIAQPLIVTLELVAQQRVLLVGVLLVVLETADAVQPLQIDPTPPPHAHAVHDQVRAQMYLEHRRRGGTQLLRICADVATSNVHIVDPDG